MAEGLSAVAAWALPRAIPSGSWFGRRKPTASASPENKAASARQSPRAQTERLDRRLAGSEYLIIDSFISIACIPPHSDAFVLNADITAYSGTDLSTDAVYVSGTTRAQALAAKQVPMVMCGEQRSWPARLHISRKHSEIWVYWRGKCLLTFIRDPG